MTRYKGRQSAKTVEKDFPHHVDMVVPEGGLGRRLDAMHNWQRVRGIETKSGRSWRDENNRDYVRWCFAGPNIATDFAA